MNACVCVWVWVLGVGVRSSVIMAVAFRTMHEVLGPYLSTASPPTAVSAPGGTQTRFPVQPGDAIPGGLRPVPTTTQTNKKTNVQIPYMRRATEAQGVGGVWAPTLTEGSMGFLERQQLVPRHQTNGLGPNRFVDAYSVEQVNEALKEPRADLFTYDTFPYRLDGVVNNVDGGDGAHEFKDYTLVNMAVQGHCRLDHREKYRADETVARTSATIYVGLFATRSVLPPPGNGLTPWVHKLERFSSNMITRGKIDLGEDPYVNNGTLRTLLFAWVVGRVVDPAQSESMLTIHVDVRPLRPVQPAYAESYQPNGRYVLRWKQELNAAGTRYESMPDVVGDAIEDRTVKQALLASWADPQTLAADVAARAAIAAAIAAAQAAADAQQQLDQAVRDRLNNLEPGEAEFAPVPSAGPDLSKVQLVVGGAPGQPGPSE